MSKKRVTILSLFGIRDISEETYILSAIVRGVDVNIKDSGGRTILMEAIHRKRHGLAKRLIGLGADANIRDNRDWTALHFAAQNHDIECVSLLIEHGADVNAQDSYGNTVISNAVFNSQDDPRVVGSLFRAGADPTIKNRSGISASDLANTLAYKAVCSSMESEVA